MNEKETLGQDSPLPESKKVTLTVKDRLVVPELFPRKSNIINQVIARDIAKKFEFTKEETEEIELRVLPDGRSKWNGEKAKDKEYDLTAPEVAFLKANVSRIDAENNVTNDTLDLCQKVMAL